ncbi:hypothetical protein COE51_21330 [Bacillus pseudomycoides]|nr:hypothetical protein COE51_21330 [Bacillus pseudomycoides]
MGGGNVTVRGIMYQTLISILDSLEDENWYTICVEPIDEEISDITWTLVNGNKVRRRVTQIKTTENYFDVTKIGDILNDLTSGATADIYELRLLGNLNDSAYKFIDKLLKGKDFTTGTEKKYDALRKYVGKIDIRIDPLSDGMFGMSIIGHLFKIASSYNLKYHFDVFEVCADYLLGNKLKLSVDGITESKQDYIDKIKDFLSLCKKEIEAIDKIYFQIIENAKILCRLDHWSSWTNTMIIDPPEIPSELYYSTCEFDAEVRQIVWPKELLNLELAIKLFANRIWFVMDTFLYKGEIVGDKTVAIRHHEKFGKKEDGSYIRMKRDHENWHKTIQNYLRDATSALNWIVEEAKEHLDSTMFGPKYFQYGIYHSRLLTSQEKEILKKWDISYKKNSPFFEEIFEEKKNNY